MGQLSIYTEKNEVGPLYHTTYKSHSNRIKELNEITITMKYLEENTDINFPTSEVYLRTKTQATPPPNLKLVSKDITNKVQRQSTKQEKRFSNHIANKGYKNS